MADILAFPRQHRAIGPSGVRAARIAGRWHVEHVVRGTVTRRTPMPCCEDALRVAGRTSLRDRTKLLPMADADDRPGDTSGPDDPGPAAA